MFSHFCRSGFINTLLGGDPRTTEISFILERGSSDRPEKTWTDRSLSFPDRDFPMALLPIRSILGGLKMFDLGGDPRTTEISFIRECRSSDLSEKICID
jgi:hypothetical protein